MDSLDESDTESGSSGVKPKKNIIISPARRPSFMAAPSRHHYGSFYLRMGAVGGSQIKMKNLNQFSHRSKYILTVFHLAFGIGSMIYSGLEFGQYFELERDTKCHNVMLGYSNIYLSIKLFQIKKDLKKII